MNYFCGLLFGAIYAFTPAVSRANEIDLECNGNMQRTNSWEPSEANAIKFSVVISEFPSFSTIHLLGPDLDNWATTAVLNSENFMSHDIVDGSNPRKWEISVTTDGRGTFAGSRKITYLLISRATGHLHFTEGTTTSTGAIMNLSVDGQCEAERQGKAKF